MLSDKQRERAARELCRLRGVDADAECERGSGPRKLWWFVLPEINTELSRQQVAAAIAFAQEESDGR